MLAMIRAMVATLPDALVRGELLRRMLADYARDLGADALVRLMSDGDL
jgi:hypothetical protein